jgi:hypothetical protein
MQTIYGGQKYLSDETCSEWVTEWYEVAILGERIHDHKYTISRS